VSMREELRWELSTLGPRAWAAGSEELAGKILSYTVAR